MLWPSWKLSIGIFIEQIEQVYKEKIFERGFEKNIGTGIFSHYRSIRILIQGTKAKILNGRPLYK